MERLSLVDNDDFEENKDEVNEGERVTTGKFSTDENFENIRLFPKDCGGGNI